MAGRSEKQEHKSDIYFLVFEGQPSIEMRGQTFKHATGGVGVGLPFPSMLICHPGTLALE